MEVKSESDVFVRLPFFRSLNSSGECAEGRYLCNSLKVEGDCYVDDAVGVGDAAEETQGQLDRLHHHEGERIGERAWESGDCCLFRCLVIT